MAEVKKLKKIPNTLQVDTKVGLTIGRINLDKMLSIDAPLKNISRGPCNQG